MTGVHINLEEPRRRGERITEFVTASPSRLAVWVTLTFLPMAFAAEQVGSPRPDAQSTGAPPISPVSKVSPTMSSGCYPLPREITGWWPGEGDATSRIRGNHGIALNGTGFADGKSQRAFLFDGMDDCVRIPYSPMLISANFSVEVWVKPTAQVRDRENQDLIFGQVFGTPQLAVRPGPNGLFVFWQYFVNFFSYPGVESVRQIPINEWSHLAGTWDGTTLKLYINGALEAQNAPHERPTPSTCDFFIGGIWNSCSSYTGQFFQGSIDEVSLYNRALLPEEILAIYAAGSAGKCPPSEPAIISQPQSLIGCTGGSVTFQVSATGTEPLSYQWRRNELNINGATSGTFVVNNIQPSSTGDYTVVVSNLGGSVTSIVARLTMSLQPTISQQPQSTSVTIGSSVSLEVTANSAAPLGYQWFRNGVAVAGAVDRVLTINNVQSDAAASYVVEIANTCGRVISRSATLTVSPALGGSPALTSEPQNQTVIVGGTATFSVVAVGASPLNYQWRLNGTDLPGATGVALIINSVASSMSGNRYSVVVKNASGGVTSREAILTVLAGSGGTSFVRRQLPGGYMPGAPLTVTLQVIPPTTSKNHAIEDQPPAGWLVSNVSEGGVFDSSQRKVKFGPFFDTSNRTLTYQVTPPSGEIGQRNFVGAVSADGVNIPISGDAVISMAQFHPADNNPADWAVSASEITAYGAAWKRGDNWPVGPNPIPIDYVSRAGALWKGGESYRVDPTVSSSPPLWWVNASRSVQSPNDSTQPVAKAFSSKNTAVRSLSASYALGAPLTVNIAARPSSMVVSYAVEDQLPSGWFVTGINQSGSFDVNNGKLKWGPFFDNIPRTLTYQVTPRNSASGSVIISGTASFDGLNIPISGQPNLSALDSISIDSPRLSDYGGVQFIVNGPVGRTFKIEYSTDLAIGDWIPLTSFVSADRNTLIQDSNWQGKQARFYRVRLEQ